MLAEPRWFFDTVTNTMVINLVEFTSETIMAKEGIGTVQMSLTGEPYYNETLVPINGNITITYNPAAAQDYSVAWDNYFTKTLKMPPPTISGTTRTYTLSQVDTLIIKQYEIEIDSI